MDLADELRASLQDLFSSGPIEIREGSGRTTPLAPLSWEVRGAPDKPLLHLWAENCNVTRRVIAISDHSEERIILAVERFGRTTPDRMEIARLNFQRNPKQISREDFCEQLRRILAENFPDETVERLSIASDLEHSLSRIYARGISCKGAIRGAFLAVPQGETQDAIESSLTFALLWLEWARQSGGKRIVSFLRLILPGGKAGLLANQLGSLDIEPIDPCANGNVNSWLVPRRESELLLGRAKADLEEIKSLAPEAICAHAVPREQEVVLRFRGLPFARWKDGQIYFGIGAVWSELCRKNEHELMQLILNLKSFRNPLATNLRHPLYRVQAERWMQAMVMEDVSRVDVTLDSEHVYE